MVLKAEIKKVVDAMCNKLGYNRRAQNRESKTKILHKKKQNTQSLTVVHNLLMLYLGRSQTIYLLFLLTIISVQSRIFPKH